MKNCTSAPAPRRWPSTLAIESTTPGLPARGVWFLAVAGVLLSARGADTWRVVPGRLTTPWAAEVSPTNALPEYPRPQMVRAEWKSLNGLWDYAILPAAVAWPA